MEYFQTVSRKKQNTEWGIVMKKHLVFVLSFIFFAFFVFSTAVLAQKSAFSFTDVDKNAWYYDEVKEVYEAGIMEGKTSTSFDPTANMNRAEFVTVLARLSGDDLSGKGISLTFSDTDTEAWYADYVAWGVENDMVKGLPNNKFAPNQAVSRQEMAVFIDRFISYINTSLSDNSKIDTFADADKVADYAKEAVETMRKSGIITGDQNGNFNPTNNASRAEVATVITRILPLLDNDIVITPPDVDRENFDAQAAFMYSESSWDGFPYRIYVPSDYSTDKEYPLVLFLHSQHVGGTDNTKQLDEVKILFENSSSPAYESIVVVPQAPTYWAEGMVADLYNLLEHVNKTFNTDSTRQYVISVKVGCFAAWKMALKYPEEISAILSVYGVGPTLYGDSEGNIDTLGDVIPDALVDIPIHFVHDTDKQSDSPYDKGYLYGRLAANALKELGGFKNVYLTETSGYGPDIYKHFVSKEDVSLLEWLFAQRRETK